MRKNFTRGLIAGMVIILIITVLIFIFDSPNEKLQLIPKDQPQGQNPITSLNNEVGTGWSTIQDPKLAVKEALDMALAEKTNKNPEMVIVYTSSGSDMLSMHRAIREILGAQTKIYGGTTNEFDIMTDKGYFFLGHEEDDKHRDELTECNQEGLTLMTISSSEIEFGVGGADFSQYPSTELAAQEALKKALEDVGRTVNDTPNVVLITPTAGVEEEVLEGLENYFGKKTIILGGTAAGPNYCVVANDEIYKKGISISLIYTTLRIGWVFECGFEVTDIHSGIVTKVDGQKILTIDNRPAIDVYDEWLNGKISQILIQPERNMTTVWELLLLNPCYRKYKSSGGRDYFLFSHPWKGSTELTDKTIMTSTKLNVGEKIFLSYGTWELLINRIMNLPVKAKLQGNLGMNYKPIFSLGIICTGVMASIPKSEREKIPYIINQSNQNSPFIINFTWGEQGHFPDVGNKHGNLSTSFIVIGK